MHVEGSNIKLLYNLDEQYKSDSCICEHEDELNTTIKQLLKKIDDLETRLKKYTNGDNHKRYYEKNKKQIKEAGVIYFNKLKEENPDKIKEYSRNAYLKKKKNKELDAATLINAVHNTLSSDIVQETEHNIVQETIKPTGKNTTKLKKFKLVKNTIPAYENTIVYEEVVKSNSV